VSATVADGPAGGALGGTSTTTAVNGIATFSGLWLTVGGNYTLQINSDDSSTPLAVPMKVVAPSQLLPGNPSSSGAAAPTITAERVLYAGKGKRRQAVGIQLIFSAPLDPSSAGNSANYTVTQNVKRGRTRIAQAIRLRVAYDDAANTVTLMLAGNPKFTSGGRLLVRASAPSGIMGKSGAYLDGKVNGQAGDDGVFAILAAGRGIVR
jgi:hypothetical protein